MSESHRVPAIFTGGWQDLNSVGYRESGATPNLTYAMLLVLGPVGYSKFYPGLCLLILGLGAWTFFTRLRLTPAACVLGAIATMLNSSFFTAAAWGVASHPLTIGMIFFALAAVTNAPARRLWLHVAVAGVAVGMAVSEGADIGAIFSIFLAAYVMFQAWNSAGKGFIRFVYGAGQVFVIAICAAFVAYQLISVLVTTQIQGVAGTQQEQRTSQERWDWATQWSLPKREMLGFMVPGLFGYRMDTPDGGNYWGAVGRDPAWDRYFASGSQGQPPGGGLRFSGGAIYSGILVVIVAFWGVLQSLRREASVFSLQNRRWIWFWMAVAFLALLLSFGRFAPFYQFLYALPYFSTVRNPAKFTHVVNWALIVIFAYGVHGLWISSVEKPVAPTFKAWWNKVSDFDRRWTIGLCVAFGVCVVAWLVFANSRPEFEKYLGEVGFPLELARPIAAFSVGQVGVFLLLFGCAATLFTLVLSGRLSGRRSTWAAILLGMFIIVDLGRANAPFVVIWDYREKYSTNPIIDRLRERPYEHRVALLPQFVRLAPELGLLNEVYSIEWAQHHFLFYNIQSLDKVQMSRMPEDLLAFESAFIPQGDSNILQQLQQKFPRRWELTNTRYLLGPAAMLKFLNEQLDAPRARFRIAERFDIVPKPGVARPTKCEELTAITSTNGAYALYDFTGALPRAKLYSSWLVTSNDAEALKLLVSPDFDPHQTVLIANPLPGHTPTSSTNAGSVEFVSYAPKDIQLKADVTAPSVLLLNDRYDPNWKVYVDDKPAELLRANYLMRGVFLEPETHQVRFRFEPPTGTLYVSVAAVAIGLALCAVLLVTSRQGPAPGDAPTRATPNQPAGRKASA
jgi:hypothetical protein